MFVGYTVRVLCCPRLGMNQAKVQNKSVSDQIVPQIKSNLIRQTQNEVNSDHSVVRSKLAYFRSALERLLWSDYGAVGCQSWSDWYSLESVSEQTRVRSIATLIRLKCSRKRLQSGLMCAPNCSGKTELKISSDKTQVRWKQICSENYFKHALTS